jgi:crossover junction endodeoxyribonuclease RuvC
MKVLHSAHTVLSIDPGYERLGIAVLLQDKGKESVLFSTCIHSSKKDTDAVRLFNVGEAFKELLDTYKPDAVALEKIFFTSNQQTGIMVANVCGILKYLSSAKGLPVLEYTPTQVKMAIASHGRADKKDVHLMVEKLVSLEKRARLDDEIDAIAVGLTHLAHKRVAF